MDGLTTKSGKPLTLRTDIGREDYTYSIGSNGRVFVDAMVDADNRVHHVGFPISDLPNDLVGLHDLERAVIAQVGATAEQEGRDTASLIAACLVPHLQTLGQELRSLRQELADARALESPHRRFQSRC